MQQNNSLSNDRVDWVDYAKGICIIWVVTLYATDHVREITHSIGWMQYVVDFAQPFRMPDFFLLSGLFVSRVIDKPLRSYIDTKILHFLYFYLLWGTLKFLNTYWQQLLGPDPLHLVPEYLRMFIEPPTGPLWFIYILPLFFIAVRLLRRVPMAIVLPLAALMQMAVTFGEIELSIKVADKFARYFVFFYSGYCFARPIFKAALWTESNLRTAFAIFSVWFISNATLVAFHVTFALGMQLIMGYAGAFAVLFVASVLSRMKYTEWLRYLGKHSIVVYLGFVIPIGVMRKLIHSQSATMDVGTLALIVMVLSVLGALLIYWAVRETPFRFLFSRPKWTSIQTHKMTGLKSSSVT